MKNQELNELYQEVILDHYKNPKNYSVLEKPTHKAEGYNALCGDKVTIYLDVHDGVIRDIRFQGLGCAISKASASVMTTELKGKTLEEAKELFKKFQHLVTQDMKEEPDPQGLGKLAVFTGVREYPSRVKCAVLPWHTVIAALESEGESEKVVSTE